MLMHVYVHLSVVLAFACVRMKHACQFMLVFAGSVQCQPAFYQQLPGFVS